MHERILSKARAFALAIGVTMASGSAFAEAGDSGADGSVAAATASTANGSAAAVGSPSAESSAASGTREAAPATKPGPGLKSEPRAESSAPSPPAPIAVFTTRILSGGSLSALKVDVQSADLQRLPASTIVWKPPTSFSAGCAKTVPEPTVATVHGQSPALDNGALTILSVPIPSPPCLWPPYQSAEVTVSGEVDGRGTRMLFAGTVRVSVWWFPLVLALASVCLIYPGCALISWYLARNRAQIAVAAGKKASVPTFWSALDPIQITASGYGRASLAKLQIFVFSLIVFGLLLYFQFRNGVLSGLSEDVLFLLGISAVGTVGGRAAYAAKRRLGLDNWAWLRRQGWLPQPVDGVSCDVATRASWRELIVDYDSKEFDVYSFQMAIFSLVVAAALVTTSLTGLATFEIPPELLGLLGLSQIVFIGGKAVEKSAYNELDQRLDSLRTHERKYQEAMAVCQSATGDALTKAQAEAEVERKAFKTDVQQAAEIFWSLYGETMPSKPQKLDEAGKLEPENH